MKDYTGTLAAVSLIATLHLGTLVMTAVFASTVFLDAKQTTAIAVVVMFVMFFIGDFSAIMSLTVGESLQHFSTWFYYKAAQVFGAGNFVNLAGDALVLLVINVAMESQVWWFSGKGIFLSSWLRKN